MISDMIFCKFDKSISVFPYEEAVGYRLIAAPALKRVNQYGSHVGFCADKLIELKFWWWKYILDYMALKKKFLI